jgi:hypothetical protein
VDRACPAALARFPFEPLQLLRALARELLKLSLGARRLLVLERLRRDRLQLPFLPHLLAEELALPPGLICMAALDVAPPLRPHPGQTQIAGVAPAEQEFVLGLPVRRQVPFRFAGRRSNVGAQRE